MKLLMISLLVFTGACASSPNRMAAALSQFDDDESDAAAAQKSFATMQALFKDLLSRTSRPKDSAYVSLGARLKEMQSLVEEVKAAHKALQELKARLDPAQLESQGFREEAVKRRESLGNALNLFDDMKEAFGEFSQTQGIYFLERSKAMGDLADSMENNLAKVKEAEKRRRTISAQVRQSGRAMARTGNSRKAMLEGLENLASQYKKVEKAGEDYALAVMDFERGAKEEYNWSGPGLPANKPLERVIGLREEFLGLSEKFISRIESYQLVRGVQ